MGVGYAQSAANRNVYTNDLLSMTMPELSAFVTSLGQPAFRAEQIRDWLYRGYTYEEMSNLPKALRTMLSEKTVLRLPKGYQKLVSKLDGTVKYLFSLSDGQLIESVVMRYEHGTTICISSQAGCRMGCKFCASTLKGKDRDLYPSELLGQVIAAQRDLGERISGIVMMGIGEPLDNYDNVIRFLKLAGDPKGLGISYRSISLSTCGLVDRIYDLAKEEFPITLSISLHAVCDSERSAIMPVNNKYNMDKLLTACRDYFKTTGRRISFEYTLIAGVNDDDAHARDLAAVLKKYLPNMPFHVNLIPVNTVAERGFVRGNQQAIRRFCNLMQQYKVNATVRRSLGGDINASCGQLRHNEQNKE
jgi:23S rRNA (adenine2503-C2)-methyltransferase